MLGWLTCLHIWRALPPKMEASKPAISWHRKILDPPSTYVHYIIVSYKKLPTSRFYFTLNLSTFTPSFSDCSLPCMVDLCLLPCYTIPQRQHEGKCTRTALRFCNILMGT